MTLARSDVGTITTLLTLASVAVIVLVPPDADEIWWLKPAIVLAGAYSLYRFKSILAAPVFAIGCALLVRNYKRKKVREAVNRLTAF